MYLITFPTKTNFIEKCCFYSGQVIRYTHGLNKLQDGGPLGEQNCLDRRHESSHDVPSPYTKLVF